MADAAMSREREIQRARVPIGFQPWLSLLVVFAARLAIGYQFQTVASLTPQLSIAYDLDAAMLGLLVGIYLVPGVVFSYFAGLLGAEVGDRPIAVMGLLLMALGGLISAVAPTYEVALAGRVIAGSGAIFFNVLGVKLVADWFSARDLPLAMALYLNSWPMGLALALLTLPVLAASYSLTLCLMVAPVLALFGALLLLIAYRRPAVPGGEAAIRDDAAARPTAKGVHLTWPETRRIVVCAIAWVLYQSALILVITFGLKLLGERGVGAEQAGVLVGLGTWLGIVFGPIGGLVGQRGVSNYTVFGATLLVTTVIVLAISQGSTFFWLFVAFGVVAWMAGGPATALTLQLVRPSVRSRAMGVYYSLFHVGTGLFPVLGGWLIDQSGTAASAYYLAAAALVCALVSLAVLRAMDRPSNDPAIGRRG